MNKLNGWDWAALVLVIIGGLNWGIVALNKDYDLVAILSGNPAAPFTRIVYGVIGLAAIYLLFISRYYARK